MPWDVPWRAISGPRARLRGEKQAPKALWAGESATFCRAAMTATQRQRDILPSRSFALCNGRLSTPVHLQTCSAAAQAQQCFCRQRLGLACSCGRLQTHAAASPAPGHHASLLGAQQAAPVRSAGRKPRARLAEPGGGAMRPLWQYTAHQRWAIEPRGSIWPTRPLPPLPRRCKVCGAPCVARLVSPQPRACRIPRRRRP